MTALVPKPPDQETVLIAWLCIMRHNLDDSGGDVFFIPTEIRDGLIERGWCEATKPDADGNRQVHITDLGCRESDLAAPEWGINPVPTGSD